MGPDRILDALFERFSFGPWTMLSACRPWVRARSDNIDSRLRPAKLDIHLQFIRTSAD